MQELYNKVLAATNPFEVIKLSDEFLDKHLTGYIKLMFLKGETLLSLARFDDALYVFKQIINYNNTNFTGRAHNSIGFCYFLKNEFEKANSEFEKCSNESLQLNSAILNLAAYYSKTIHKQNTYKIFKELYNMDPANKHDDVHMSFLTLASTPEELIHIFDSTIDEIYVPDLNVLFAKGDGFVSLESFDEAIPVFEEILKYRNNSDTEIAGKTHTALGICHFRKNELNKALFEFENARKYSDDSLVLYNLASTYTLLNQKKKGLEVYKELSKREPYNQDVKKIIKMLEVELKREKPINNIPFNSIEDALTQADTYWELKDYEKVIEVYDLISDSMPKQPLVWNRKGDAYYQLGRYEEAIECFDKAFEYNPHFPFPLYYKTLCYMGLEDYENAENTVVQALMFFPDSPGFLNNYCVILNKLGKYEEALDAADKALISNPNSVETYTNKAHALKKLCEIDEALECYDKALKIDPNIIDAWLDKADALKDFEMFDEALECYKEALTHFPHNPDILHYMSVLYLIKGDLDNSSKCLEESKKYSDL